MKLLKELEISYNNIDLYEQALTHSSYANEHNTINYERLEFLGDAVLQLIISEYLYLNYNENEGAMTKIRSHYVCEQALYDYSISLKINDYIKLGKGEIESGGKYKKVIVADVFEAFLGAMFLDIGFEKTKEFVYKFIIPIIESEKITFVEDHKSTLQELIQTDKRILEYVVLKEEGPAHMKRYTVAVKIDNVIYGKGVAGSKKAAEQKAAAECLKKGIN